MVYLIWQDPVLFKAWNCCCSRHSQELLKHLYHKILWYKIHICSMIEVLLSCMLALPVPLFTVSGNSDAAEDRCPTATVLSTAFQKLSTWVTLSWVLSRQLVPAEFWELPGPVQSLCQKHIETALPGTSSHMRRAWTSVTPGDNVVFVTTACSVRQM